MMAAPAMAQQNAAAIEYGKELQECSVWASLNKAIISARGFSPSWHKE
jgi:hypothetical protein